MSVIEKLLKESVVGKDDNAADALKTLLSALIGEDKLQEMSLMAQTMAAVDAIMKLQTTDTEKLVAHIHESRDGMIPEDVVRSSITQIVPALLESGKVNEQGVILDEDLKAASIAHSRMMERAAQSDGPSDGDMVIKTIQLHKDLARSKVHFTLTVDGDDHIDESETMFGNVVVWASKTLIDDLPQDVAMKFVDQVNEFKEGDTLTFTTTVHGDRELTFTVKPVDENAVPKGEQIH